MNKLNNATIGKVQSPNYGKLSFKEKIKKKLRNRFVNLVDKTVLQFGSYSSFWHYKFFKSKITNVYTQHYLTQKPDYGAGIGHQLANWNTAFYFATYFSIKFAHTPFSSEKWESLLGFGENEVLAIDLINNKEFKKVRLPRFDSNSPSQIQLVKEIIYSYKTDKIIFIFEMNQGYMNQYEPYLSLSKKFFNANARMGEKLIFNPNSYNIAIHIRRRMKIESDEVWEERGLKNDYFVNILKTVLTELRLNTKIEIYLFSQGIKIDFKEFSEFVNFHFCIDMNPYDSFVHMAKADLLISSKSSFSYKPGLISKGTKICPSTFWHYYPDTPDFILADNRGFFDTNKFISQIKLS